MDPSSTTISQAQAAMVTLVQGGYSTFCPCCKQVVSVQERDISPMMAKVLIVLYRKSKVNSDWLQVSSIIEEENRASAEIRGSEWTKLTHWGLLEEKPKAKGLYKVTEKGTQFAKGESKAPKAIRMYNGKFLGFEEGQVTIQECLGDTYDYDKLMAGDYLDFNV